MKKIINPLRTMVVVITGTPGTGKTTLAKKLAKRLSYKLIFGKSIITRYKLSGSYDEERRCKVVDVKKLNKVLVNIIAKEKKNKTTIGMVIESHLSHYLPKDHVDLCVVTKCSLKVLKKRLEKRRYSAKKVRENMDCEIFDLCCVEASECGHDCVVVDTTKTPNITALSTKILKKFK